MKSIPEETHRAPGEAERRSWQAFLRELCEVAALALDGNAIARGAIGRVLLWLKVAAFDIGDDRLVKYIEAYTATGSWEALRDAIDMLLRREVPEPGTEVWCRAALSGDYDLGLFHSLLQIARGDEEGELNFQCLVDRYHPLARAVRLLLDKLAGANGPLVPSREGEAAKGRDFRAFFPEQAE